MKSFNLKLIYLALLSIPVLLWSCDEEERIDLADNPEQREEVYQQILSDERLFTEFMNEMRENRQTMGWMASDTAIMRNMYGRRHMQQVMRNHPEVIDTMMQGMMGMYNQDTAMYRRNPAMNHRFMQHMWTMMERDTAMYRQMQERMRQNRD